MAVLGLGVLLTALAFAVGPYQQTREFRRLVACDRREGNCFATEQGFIRARRTYYTTSTQTDAEGNTTTTTTTHFEVTWERPGGARQARDVAASFYNHAEPDQPANLRTWHGEVVGIEVMGDAQWFLPGSGDALTWWLYLAWSGLGVLLWALFAGWWDGLFMLAFRTFAWMFVSGLPVEITTDALAYGPPTGTDLVVDVVFGVFFTGIGGAMLVGSLNRW